MSNLLNISQLQRNYHGIPAVKGITLALDKGETLGLLGPNGAGRSTTLQMIAGTLQPNAGKIEVLGKNMQHQPLAARRNIGYLPENPPLYEELSVTEYLRFCAGLRRIPRAQRQQAINHELQRCGLTQVANKVIRQLSKGYQQRVGIAQAIIHRPALVILDEPTVGLDPNQIREIRSLISEIAIDSGVILSSHILSEVQSICNRILIMNRGEIAYDSAQADVAEHGFRLTLSDTSPLPDEVDLIRDIAKIDPLGNNDYLLTPRQAIRPDALLRQLLEAGLAVERFGPTQDLEATFVRVTTGIETA